jgi:hypothetical protein
MHTSTLLSKMNIDKDFRRRWGRLRLGLHINAEITPKIVYVDGNQRYWSQSKSGILLDLAAPDGRAIEEPFAQAHEIRTRRRP